MQTIDHNHWQKDLIITKELGILDYFYSNRANILLLTFIMRYILKILDLKRLLHDCFINVSQICNCFQKFVMIRERRITFNPIEPAHKGILWNRESRGGKVNCFLLCRRKNLSKLKTKGSKEDIDWFYCDVPREGKVQIFFIFFISFSVTFYSFVEHGWRYVIKRKWGNRLEI